jgi:SAM-dependent methyltransferase
VVGTAMALPVADASFDVVTNVESSHCYPDIEAFYREVARVLRPGGIFLYTDLLPSDPDLTGFDCLRRDDITSQVLAACDRTASRRRNAFGAASDALDTFLGVPGSRPYEDMKHGRQRYVLCWFRKTGTCARHSAARSEIASSLTTQ